MAVPADSVPPVLRLLAEPMRWRLMRELSGGDKRVRELVTATGQPQNLVSYHLRQLRDGGLVTARRSSFDARDTYYSLNPDGCSQALTDASAALHPGLALIPATGGPGAGTRVLFVCTGNSGRSPMAAALLRRRAGERVEAASAGTRPKPVHPGAVAVMRERYGIDIAGHQPVHVSRVADERFDYVITVCDKARETCPEFAARPGRIHWSIPDPAAGSDRAGSDRAESDRAESDGAGSDRAGSDRAGYPAFERTAAELDTRIRFLLPTLVPETQALLQQYRLM